MNASEAVMVLTAAATVDKRTIGEADARMWAEILPDTMGPRLAVEAVKAYYRENSRMIMPADVVAYEMAARKRLGGPGGNFLERLQSLPRGNGVREGFIREYYEIRATGADAESAADRAAEIVGQPKQIEGDAA